jgi:hypothetical protein
MGILSHDMFFLSAAPLPFGAILDAGRGPAFLPACGKGVLASCIGLFFFFAIKA